LSPFEGGFMKQVEAFLMGL